MTQKQAAAGNRFRTLKPSTWKKRPKVGFPLTRFSMGAVRTNGVRLTAPIENRVNGKPALGWLSISPVSAAACESMIITGVFFINTGSRTAIFLNRITEFQENMY